MSDPGRVPPSASEGHVPFARREKYSETCSRCGALAALAVMGDPDGRTVICIACAFPHDTQPAFEPRRRSLWRRRPA